ncbi:glycosyltransferase family 4 protein [Pengzhenrongella sicca]|uniref:D-inositol 3-phosphate glycosyltransferase n=1 Tax=Pengzhenrongella sicca TaxID=2819238 RepID=A0A8A4ZAT5_9MICO|nr:glycosyltransferase family 4 protein [Pengzhenrongella sicca]QTE29032.1 glycosyltransferase family 4 protein [Pengzhenrongella sicca]
MHIALITHHYAPEVGAPQRRWGALIPRFIEAGHSVSVLAPPPHYSTGVPLQFSADERPGASTVGEHGEQIYRLRYRAHGLDLVSRTVDQGITATDAVTRGMRELTPRSHRPDVVVATVPGMPSIGAGVALRRWLRVPLVVEMRDAWPDLIEPSDMWAGSTRKRRGWRGAMTSQAHKAMTHAQHEAATIVTTTRAFAEVLRSRDMDRVEVIRNGAYLDEVPRLGMRVRTGGPFRVLYLGTVGRSQGLASAVRASAILRSRGIPIELRIVGSGADYDALVALAESLGAPVEFLGKVPRAEVPAHFAWADTLLISLRSWEPLKWTVPSKMYECLATGRHITAVLAGEAAEIIRSTGAGDVVPPEDPAALADLWTHLVSDPRRLEMDGAGRAWAFRHANFEILAARYLGILTDVVE